MSKPEHKEYIRCGYGPYAFRPESWRRVNALKECNRLAQRIEELEAALIAIASAPYPLHDHCTEEQWEMACNLYQASLEGDDALCASEVSQ